MFILIVFKLWSEIYQLHNLYYIRKINSCIKSILHRFLHYLDRVHSKELIISWARDRSVRQSQETACTTDLLIQLDIQEHMPLVLGQRVLLAVQLLLQLHLSQLSQSWWNRAHLTARRRPALAVVKSAEPLKVEASLTDSLTRPATRALTPPDSTLTASEKDSLVEIPSPRAELTHVGSRPTLESEDIVLRCIKSCLDTFWPKWPLNHLVFFFHCDYMRYFFNLNLERY